MIEIPVITEARRIATERLETRVLFAGDEDGVPVVFVHGNLSAATWWEETMLRLPAGYRAIAPDLRAYGEADPGAVVDATRGMRDFSDDLAALLDTLGIGAAHLVGHSLGGSVLWQFLADYPDRCLSLTQVCPGSPYGFGGCKADGSPCFPDGAGTGGGTVNPGLVNLMEAGARGAESDHHPRKVLNAFVWLPPFVPERIEALLSATLAQKTGPLHYPGDFVPSVNWPGMAPGKYGPINAMSPIYQDDPLGFVARGTKVPILWIRGAEDCVVADASLHEMGTLGKLGVVPGWPGPDFFPPQPMIAQTAAVLDAFEAAGGQVVRRVFEHCGHSPYLEQPEAFDAALHGFLAGR